MYIGQTQFDKEHITEFLRVAKDLRVEELLMQDDNFELENNLSDTNKIESINPEEFKSDPKLTTEQTSKFTKIEAGAKKLQMGLEKFKCDKCDASFTWERNFKRHQRRFHKNESNSNLDEEMKEDDPHNSKISQMTNSSVKTNVSYLPTQKTAESTIPGPEIKSNIPGPEISEVQRVPSITEYSCNQCEFKATSLGVLKDHIIDDHVKNRFKNILGTK